MASSKEPKVDLGVAKKGDWVHFRCGGKARIKEISRHTEDVLHIVFEYFENDNEDCKLWWQNGSHADTVRSKAKCLLDIIEVYSEEDLGVF